MHIRDFNAVFGNGTPEDQSAKERAKIQDAIQADILRAKIDQQLTPAIAASARSLLEFLRNGVRLKALIEEFKQHGMTASWPASLLCEPKQLAEVVETVVETGMLSKAEVDAMFGMG